MDGFDRAQASADLTRGQARLQRTNARLLRSLRREEWAMIVLAAATALFGAVQVWDRAWLAAAMAGGWFVFAISAWRRLPGFRRIIASASEMSRLADEWRRLYEDAIGLKPKP